MAPTLTDGAKVVAITVHFTDSALDRKLERKRLEGVDQAVFLRPGNKDLGPRMLRELEHWALLVFDSTS